MDVFIYDLVLLLQAEPDHGVYTVFVKLGDTLIEVSGSAVERQSLASVLSPSCARPVAYG